MLDSGRREAEDFCGMGRDECVPASSAPDSFLRRDIQYGGSRGAHEDPRTREPAGHGSAAGVWKMGAVK